MSITNDPVWGLGYQSGRAVTKLMIKDQVYSLEDKWFEAPWGLQDWKVELIGQRLITGELITGTEDIYVRLFDVIDIIEGKKHDS